MFSKLMARLANAHPRPHFTHTFSEQTYFYSECYMMLCVIFQDSEAYSYLLTQIAPDGTGVTLTPMQVS